MDALEAAAQGLRLTYLRIIPNTAKPGMVRTRRIEKLHAGPDSRQVTTSEAATTLRWPICVPGIAPCNRGVSRCLQVQREERFACHLPS